MNPPGLRIGTPALTTRGLVEDDLREIAEVIVAALGDDFDSERDSLLERSRALMETLSPLPAALSRDASSAALKIWADMSGPAHVLVLRPIIERLRAQGHEVLDHGPRVHADPRAARAARDGLHADREARRRPRVCASCSG